MKNLILSLMAFAGLVSAQTLCLTTSPVRLVQCPAAASTWGNIGGQITSQTDLQNALAAKQPTLTVASLSALLVAAGVAQPITTLAANAPGALYFTLVGVNAVTLCVAGTQSPGCPASPVAALLVPYSDGTVRSSFAYSAQNSQGVKTGPAFWVPMSSVTPVR